MFGKKKLYKEAIIILTEIMVDEEEKFLSDQLTMNEFSYQIFENIKTIRSEKLNTIRFYHLYFFDFCDQNKITDEGFINQIRNYAGDLNRFGFNFNNMQNHNIGKLYFSEMRK